MISVCMATYNGEAFIRKQLDSILTQLQQGDELIISDDGSTDSTREIVREYSSSYPCIRLVDGPRRGVVQNFENAIRHAAGDIIFLSDQDDVWVEGKVEHVMKCFEDDNCFVVLHDAKLIDADDNIVEPSFYARRGSKKGFIKNIVKNSYLGCCMAFRTSFRATVLPMPKKIEMHDWWIGMLAEVCGHARLINDALLLYRRHGNNVSSFHHHPLRKMIFNRVYLVWHLAARLVARK